MFEFYDSESSEGKLQLDEEYSGTWVTHLDPCLAGHVPFFHLVAGQWASSIMIWSLPAQVNVLSGHFQNLEVLRGTWSRFRTETPSF